MVFGTTKRLLNVQKISLPLFFGFKIVVDPVARILKSCINKNNVSVRIVPCVLLVKSINGCGCIKVAHLWKYGYTVEGVSDWYMNGFYFFLFFIDYPTFSESVGTRASSLK